MKNYWKFMLAAFAIAAAVSCAKEEIEDPTVQEEIENPAPDQGTNEEGQLVPMTITVTGENAMGSNGANESAAKPGVKTDVADDNNCKSNDCQWPVCACICDCAWCKDKTD